MEKLIKVFKGGSGSGDFGHTGRPGKRGGSGGGGRSRKSSWVSPSVLRFDEDPNIKNIENNMNIFPSSYDTSPNEKLVRKMSKISGVSEDRVNRYISLWNSGDDVDRFIVAESARQELGADLSPYEKKNRAKFTDRAKNSGDLDDEVFSDYKKIARASYDATQDRLKRLKQKRGIVLYRGVSGDQVADLKEGDTVNWHGNSLDSWTINKYIPSLFTDALIDEGGATLKSFVPIDRIFSMPSTGPGTSAEFEFIVLGNGPDDKVLITEVVK